MKWYQKLWAWIKILLRMYEKEIRAFVDEMLDLAFQNLDTIKAEKLTPAIKKKITNKVLADILLMKIDIATIRGKSEVAKIVTDTMNWILSEEE